LAGGWSVEILNAVSVYHIIYVATGFKFTQTLVLERSLGDKLWTADGGFGD